MMKNFDYDLFAYLIMAVSIVILIFLFCLSIYYIIFWTISGRKCPVVPHSDKYTKFAVLIAARNESKVIRNIFNSLKEQTYPSDKFDVWAIVEDINDPTVNIAKEYGFNYFVRDRLMDGRKTKGFALQECIDYFKRNNIKYDAYMIFDADNVMDNNYIEVMNDIRQTGVQVALGNRCFTNADTNWLTAGSAIMFTYMNQITSRGRTILFHKATLMGTGYYINADIIDEAGGWIFTGMTEDIQLTTYCYYHDIYMRYYPLVNFYDEQSPTYKVVHIQHLRWLFGYFERRSFIKKAGVNRDYHTKEMQRFMRFEFECGLFPFLFFNIISLILFILCLVFGSFAVIHQAGGAIPFIFALGGWQIFMIFLTFFVPAFMTVFRYNNSMKLSKKNAIIGVLTYVFYFGDFVLGLFDGWLHPSKKTNWKPIKHTGEIKDDSAKKVS